jgi:DNA polymerase/3'-5' exonuclease PolX
MSSRITKTRKSKKTKQLHTPVNNPNYQIITILETVKSWYSKQRNTIHVNAYERAIHTIKKWPHPITNGKELVKEPGIGKGMVGKIDTILATGTLPIIKEKKLTIKNSYHKENANKEDISTVLGFGEKVARIWKLSHGVQTVSQLRAFLSNHPETPLTRIQRLGLQYHTDLSQKIPRVEITEIGSSIQQALKAKSALHFQNVMVFLAGSYPSGLKAESKDIDILLVNHKGSNLNLEDLIKKIGDVMPIETITMGANKFLGVVKRDNKPESKWRHLDMRLVDIVSFPFAWSYFSSGKVFNKFIRERVKKRGYKLNEYGIYNSETGKRVILEGEIDLSQLKTKVMNKKDMLEYAERIEQKLFKLADVEYQTIRERY